MLEKEEIARLIPHQGDMILLDRIAEWSATHIACTTRSHLNPDNPLRGSQGLSAVCGIEYGMQAIAAHGSLVDAQKNRPGFLASLRDVKVGAVRLDDIEGELTVSAAAVHVDPNSVVYKFTISSGERELLSGQAVALLK